MSLRQLSFGQTYVLLAALLAVAVIVSAAMGSFIFTPGHMESYLAQTAGLSPLTLDDALDRNVFLRLRLPRVVLCGFTGAALGASGALMQGLFRNPIVEPGLTGTSAGAALGAALVFVLGGLPAFSLTDALGALAVPVFAFLGALLATLLAFRLSSSLGKVNVFALLLAGMAINAVCNAGTGFLSFIARDPQARNITFWNLGTFTTAEWNGALLVAAIFALSFSAAMRYRKFLNALMLGEDEAAYLGFDMKRGFLAVILLNTLMVATATALVGVIAFVGLIVPHILRILRSSDYRFLLPASALLGALVMEFVDVAARLVIAPAELPVGIITAVIGAPVFLFILGRRGLPTP